MPFTILQEILDGAALPREVINANFELLDALIAAGFHVHRTMIVPMGAKNGTNMEYTVDDAEYIAGSLLVVHNGDPIPASRVTETTPASGVFTLDFAPQSTDDLYTSYAVAAAL